jgi:hypothetical protein
MNQRYEDEERVRVWIEPLGFWEATWGLHDDVTIKEQDDTRLHSFTVFVSHPVQKNQDLWDSEEERMRSGYLPIEVRTESFKRADRGIWVSVDYDPSREHCEVLPYVVDLFQKVDALTKNTYDQLMDQSEAIRRVILGREAPWKLIDGPPQHKRAVELWWSGMEHEDIAEDEQVFITSGSVRTLLSRLRSKYGREIVPRIEDLRNKGIR